MVPAFLTRCARAARLLLTACRLAWVAARSWVRAVLGAAVSRDDEPVVYRVYAFNSNAGDDSGFFREISPRHFNPATWEADTGRATGWPAFRVEVRYRLRGRKHRMVLHRGDACSFPGRHAGQPVCRLPKGVLSARLQGPPGSNVDVDVTSRVMKYQGPRGDFHAGAGLRVRLHEMFPFPFDDGDDDGGSFTHLRIIDTMARLHDLPYGANPVVRLS